MTTTTNAKSPTKPTPIPAPFVIASPCRFAKTKSKGTNPSTPKSADPINPTHSITYIETRGNKKRKYFLSIGAKQAQIITKITPISQPSSPFRKTNPRLAPKMKNEPKNRQIKGFRKPSAIINLQPNPSEIKAKIPFEHEPKTTLNFPGNPALHTGPRSFRHPDPKPFPNCPSHTPALSDDHPTIKVDRHA